MDHSFWHGRSQSLLRVSSMGEFWSPRCARQNERLFLLSSGLQHDCHPRLHVCISCHSQRKHARHIASIRDMLHIESSRRFWRICVKACRAHMRIRALASADRVHVKLDRRFRHVCPFLVRRLPRKCCTCQIQPSFPTCSHFSGASRWD